MTMTPADALLAVGKSCPRLQGGFKIADILSANDKTLVGYDPNSDKINEAAIAIANYRYSGAIQGDVTSQFVDAVKNAIATTGGYPSNPAALMPPTAQLASDTLSAIFSALDANR